MMVAKVTSNLPTVKIKYCNVMIDGKNFFNQPIKNDLKIYDNIKINLTGQGDDCTTDFYYIIPILKNTVN